MPCLSANAQTETGATRRIDLHYVKTRIFSLPAPARDSRFSHPMRQIKLLSNGSYHVLVTADGGGFSRWRDTAVTRWREDASGDPWGNFCYLRDEASGSVWSSTPQPSPSRADRAPCWLEGGRASFEREVDGIETRTEIVVSRDAAVELRRVVITNLGASRRTLSATSYAEIVLAAAATDAAHPAFSKLFVETSINAQAQAIFATRRPSTPTDPTPWLFHSAQVRGQAIGRMSFETDRMRFIGRGRSTAAPQALDNGSALSGSAGPVLDAVAAIRVPMTLAAGASVTIDWFTGVAPSRTECEALAQQHQSQAAADAALVHAGAYGQHSLRRLQASDADAVLYERMAAAIVYADGARRGAAATIAQNQRGQSALWGFGISGDRPIVLVVLTGPARLGLIRQMLQSHFYCLAFGLRSDLVLVCASALFDQVKALVASGLGADLQIAAEEAQGVFVLDDGKLDPGDHILLRSVARLVIGDAAGSLESQMASAAAPAPDKPPVALAQQAQGPQTPSSAAPVRPGDGLLGFNGYGGFSPDGREYLITTSAQRMTPAPWVNVIANPGFGTLVSESGSATTWAENAHEFRLTPWSNDPVADPNTEAIYIRDSDTGRCWSPTLLPTRSAGPYLARHGFGYSSFEHVEDGIESELRVFVAIDEAVKYSVLTLRNRSDRTRRLSVTGYLAWVLGDEREKTLMHVVTERDAITGALFARNGYNTDFVGRTAFFDVDNRAEDGSDDHRVEVCGDRADFFGPTGNLAAPAALAQAQWPGRLGAALDPCAALRVAVELAPAQLRVVVFKLGAGATADGARDLVQRSRQPRAAPDALDAVHAFWQHTLGAVQVHTPDATLDVLANGWLLYQLIASRLWGRTGFYQSSGAFGFRDQLQDVMALVHAAPALVREHLLRAASRQFVEGDVQHWWHPPAGKGVRTRCADDLLWLPLVICRYVEVTGDSEILDAPCPFLTSRALKDGEASNYEVPKVSDEVASLYAHGVRAIRRALVHGAHGLPLMGSGDWNDGMNLVGAGGQGESVWMAFFLVTVLRRFAPLALARGDADFAECCDQEANRLRASLEASAWDGAWYLRAWFDDGSVLGSAANTECQIDSIAQSWAVLSGAAPANRARRAMASLDERLVHRDTRLVQLLAPPFDTSQPSPGYIQGYVPGVRENGGQYTHAAVWAAMAFAALGDADRAWALFAMLNPLHHASSPADVAVYQVEPYALAGDVYAFAPHAGRGGWTWYTGSAGWMYQFVVESLLGLQRIGNQLQLHPLLPKTWRTFNLNYRHGKSTFAITCRIAADGAVPGVVLDGVESAGNTLTLVDDGKAHAAVMTVARRE
jgi:cyclic beta-1,2-glucan synthetase